MSDIKRIIVLAVILAAALSLLYMKFGGYLWWGLLVILFLMGLVCYGLKLYKKRKPEDNRCA